MVSSTSSIYRALGFAVQKTAQNFDKIDLSYNAVQAFLTRQANRDPKFFAQVEKVQAFFYIADTGSLFWSASSLLKDIALKRKVSPYIKNIHPGITIISILVFAALTTCLINKYFKPSSIALQNENVAWNRPLGESAKQFLYVSRLVINIGIIYLSSGGIIPIITLGLELYSLVEVTQRKWLEFKKIENITNPNVSRYARQISVTYSFLIQSLYNTTPETCSICLEDDQANPSDIFFCSNHTFHTPCVMEMIQHKVNSFINGLSVDHRNVNETRHYTNGFHTHSTYSAKYTISMPHANVPNCPNCREQPSHNGFHVQLNDNEHGWSSTSINWRN